MPLHFPTNPQLSPPIPFPKPDLESVALFSEQRTLTAAVYLSHHMAHLLKQALDSRI